MMRPPIQPNRPMSSFRPGFTLIEACLTTVIVGTGVLAIVGAQQTYLQKNDWSVRTAQGFQLVNELREMTNSLPLHDPITPAHVGAENNENSVLKYDDVDDFAGVINNGTGMGSGIIFTSAAEIAEVGGTAPAYQQGPINAQRQVIQNLQGWRQIIYVEYVLPIYINAASDSAYIVPLTATTGFQVRVHGVAQYKRPIDPISAYANIFEMYWVVGQ